MNVKFVISLCLIVLRIKWSKTVCSLALANLCISLNIPQIEMDAYELVSFKGKRKFVLKSSQATIEPRCPNCTYNSQRGLFT